MDFGKLSCFFFVQPKGGPKSLTIQLWGGPKSRSAWLWMPFEIQPVPLYWQILARLYIFEFSNAWHRPVLADFGLLWISKGPPKSNLFKTNQHKTKKNNVQEGVLKQHDFLMPKWSVFALYLLQNISFLCVSRKGIENERQQGVPKTCPKYRFVAQGTYFWFFGRLVERSDMLISFWSAISLPQVKSNRDGDAKNTSTSYLLGGPRQRRGQAEAFRVSKVQVEFEKTFQSLCPCKQGRRI